MAAADAGQVLCALRLGWAFAELRGRLRPGDRLVSIEPLSDGLRAQHALPLGGERRELEQLIETETVVGALAAELSLDIPSTALTGQAAAGQQPASQRLVDLAKTYRNAQGTARPPAWDDLAEFLWAWDARIQDELAASTFTVASAYQLGRGLSEIAWLDPTKAAPDNSTSWTFVLGARRVETLQRLVTRLGSYFSPATANAVSKSLDAWREAAANAQLTAKPATQTALIMQTRRWRDLLLTGLDPLTLIPPSDFLAKARQVRPVLRAFWPELTLAALFAVVAAVAAGLLAAAKNHNSLGAVLAVIAAFGVTTSSLIARAKTQAQALVTEFKNALDGELVIDAVLVPPEPQLPSRWRPFKRVQAERKLKAHEQA